MITPTDSPTHSPSSLTQFSILSALQDCRRHTLKLAADLTSDISRLQAHPDFSPVGWHLGHIAYTEALWIAEHLAGQSRPFLQYDQLFAADGLPKDQRQNLPHLADILTYLNTVREHTVRYLESVSSDDIDQAIRLWHWLLQHECQHLETMTMVLALHQLQGRPTPLTAPVAEQTAPVSCSTDMLLVEAGDYRQGSNAPEAIDNERPTHRVELSRYWIDRAPVTRGQFRQFMVAGGYQQEKWWSVEGWKWLQSQKADQRPSQVQAPLYWSEDPAFDDRPVCGVSWYEADAYARSVGKRLPTEAEWENAAACSGSIGHVWEWTDSWFTPYPGFQPFPYEGYSQIYFDNAHRVMRGGSWATLPWAKRRSFRNWYHPHRREPFVGFRCAA